MILDFLFPKSCLECKKEGKYLCDSCVSKVLDGTFDENNFAIFKYKGVIRKALISLKYKFATDIAAELTNVCVKRLNSNKYHDAVIIPVPLFWQRENFRGFNQSELMGEKLSKEMKLKFIPDLLVKQKRTNPQATLNVKERKTNLRNSFILNDKYKQTNLQNSKNIIFDDVYTTGSTIKEIKSVLNKEGYKRIYSLTIAR